MSRLTRLVLCAAILSLPAWGQDVEPRWEAPRDAASRSNPYSTKPELTNGGQKLFSRNCAVCHASGAGQKGPELGLRRTQGQQDGELFWKISNGNSRSGMPSFSSLPEGQRWQLVLYIRSLAKDVR